MSGPAELAIGAGMLVDTGLKATAVLGVGWALTVALRRGSAAQRHAVWASTFGVLAVLPAFVLQRGTAVAIDAPWVLAVWAVGAVLALVPLVRGLVTLAWLQRSLVPSGRPGVLLSDAVAGPITWGLLRPVIVLPAAAGAWTEAQRAAALAHEQAHVARRDWAVHLGAWVVSALFWFHPLVWLARRALVREAEHAADDAALAQGTRPSAYAELLLALAGTPGPRAALGAAPSLLGQRVHAVLDGRSRSARRWPAWVVAGVLGGIGLPALGAWPTWAPTPEAELTCAPAEPDAP